MFLDVWREKRIKRNPDEAIKSYSGATPTSCIKRIGLLIDTTVDVDVELLTEYIEGLRQHARLATICYVRHVNKMGFHANSTFDNTAFNWQGELNNAQVDFFLNQEYDLLISYYAEARPVLQFITAKASACLKVGFPSRSDHQLNDLTIDTKPENVTIFCSELKNYLRILKRIE
jgi:hypothetical protein